MLKEIMLYLWQLPQHILALLYSLYLHSKYELFSKRNLQDAIIYDVYMTGAVTLGKYIFVEVGYGSSYILKHEYGHTIQSKYLGPLYLIIIGIPSIVYCGLRRIFKGLRTYNYYDFYTESWANKLSNKYYKEE